VEAEVKHRIYSQIFLWSVEFSPDLNYFYFRAKLHHYLRNKLYLKAQNLNPQNMPYVFDAHESVRRDIIMKVTNKMQLYRLIYYS